MVMAMMENVCAKFLATYRQKFIFPQALCFCLTCSGRTIVCNTYVPSYNYVILRKFYYQAIGKYINSKFSCLRLRLFVVVNKLVIILHAKIS